MDDERVPMLRTVADKAAVADVSRSKREVLE